MSLLNYFMANEDKNGILCALTTTLHSPAYLFYLSISDIPLLKRLKMTESQIKHQDWPEKSYCSHSV